MPIEVTEINDRPEEQLIRHLSNVVERRIDNKQAEPYLCRKPKTRKYA